MSTAWKIAPGQRADNWDICRKHGCIVVDWGDIGDFRKYRNDKQILRALKREYGNEKGCGSGAARTIWRFVHVVETSDLVVANKGENTVVGLGRITSDYLHADHPDNPVPIPGEGEWWRRNARLVDWRIRNTVSLPKKNFFVASTIQRLTPDQCEEIQQAYLGTYPGLKTRLDEVFSGIPVTDNDHDSATTKLLATAEKHLQDNGDFDPSGTTDDRERILSSIVRRRGQPAFRRKLLTAYKAIPFNPTCRWIDGTSFPAAGNFYVPCVFSPTSISCV